MNLYKKFQKDNNKVESGVWFELDEDCKFLVASLGSENKAYQKALIKVRRPHEKAIRVNALSDEKSRELGLTAVCEAILLDWNGVTNEKGETLEYNAENAKKLLTDLPDLYELILEFAHDNDNYKKFEQEEELGN